MATPTPGVLLNLLEAMKRGIKPMGDHRSSLLQVTDIVPIDLDEKSLVPRRGFCIKLTDSSHSIYASLPFEQEDLVLSNKMQLGQFLYVERLEPGSPVPVIRGAKPIPRRHPFVGAPEPLMGLRGKGEIAEGKMSGCVSESGHKRANWEINRVGNGDVAGSRVVLDFDQCTPLRERGSAVRFNNGQASPLVRPKAGKDGSSSAVRASVGGGLPTKMESRGESPALVRRSCMTPSVLKFPRSKSVSERVPSRVAASPLKSCAKKSATPPPSLKRAAGFVQISGDEKNSRSSKAQRQPQSQSSNESVNCNAGASLKLPGKLGALGKEAVLRRETAQKMALQALRNANSMENVVHCLKMFSNLSRTAKPDAPAACFDQFLQFHHQISQAVTDMISIEAATEIHADSHDSTPMRPKVDTTILNEIPYNSLSRFQDTDSNSSKRKLALYKSIASFHEKTNGRTLRSHSKVLAERKGVSAATTEGDNDENQKPAPCRMSSAIRLGKQIETEAGLWFMEFLEKSLETVARRTTTNEKMDGDARKVPQQLILKIINWVEVEQCDPCKRTVHPKATLIARKLRIKMKNPV
ncbi:hypothetical protein Droror1_Dr00018580 [Drosera rotundifolia]